MKYKTRIKWSEFYSNWLKTKLPNYNLVAKNYHFTDEIFFNSKCDYKVQLEDCLIDKGCYVKNTIFDKGLSICNCKINTKATFSNCEFNSEFSFEKTIIKTECKIKNCGLKSENTKISFHKGNAIESLSLHHNEASIYISDGIYKRTIIIGETRTRLDIHGGKFDYLSIQNTPLKSFNGILFNCDNMSGKIFLQSVVTKFIQISGVMNNCSINIYNLITERIGLNAIINNSSLSLIHVKPKNNNSTFRISNSTLNDTTFNFIEFDKWDFWVYDTNFSDSKFSNIIWSRKVNESLYSKNTPLNSIHSYFFPDSVFQSQVENTRQTYRQFKQILNKSGDYVNEQLMHSLEMKSYYISLNWIREFETKLILWLSYLTSNFGQSFIRPLIGILIGTLVFFYLLLISGNYEQQLFTNVVNGNFSYINFFFNNYFYIINPIRKVNFGEFLGLGNLIDLASRIWSSYMIYNIIRASRRFIK